MQRAAYPIILMLYLRKKLKKRFSRQSSNYESELIFSGKYPDFATHFWEYFKSGSWNFAGYRVTL